MRAIRVPLAGALAPTDAVLLLRGQRRAFALIGEWGTGPAILGSEPVRIAEGDPFAALAEQPQADGGAVVGGGWVGWLGYALGGLVEELPPAPPGGEGEPFDLAFHDHVVRFDGERWWFEALVTESRREALRERLAHWRELFARGPERRPARVLEAFALTAPGAAGHLLAVEECVARIAAGELFQANLAVRLGSRFEGDPVDLAARALAAARPRFGALVGGVLSLSPERFLRREGRRVWSEPIKGTGPERDPLLAAPKDAAEHVMIVDLMRNDLGRVCAYGSVRAEPVRAEAHGDLWHLVSTVRGELREDVGDADLLRATFPPGSVTGAPKVQAMKTIAALEPRARRAFTGALGIVSPLCGLDLSVTIRALETERERIWIDAGGGVVADSTAQGELAEALAKAARPVRAVGGAIAPAPHAARPPHDLARALAHGDRPDPARGVFETVLVQDGAPLHLAHHLGRLAASARTVLGRELPGDLRERAALAAAPHARARLRIELDADGCDVEATPEPPPDRGAEPLLLRPFLLPGGLGPHKWRDRRLLAALTAAAEGAVPLLVDGDGHVLEAAHANVFVERDGRLDTPPADGRILPGVTRARVLAQTPGAGERAVLLDALAPGSVLLLSSAIRGLHRGVLAAATSARGSRCASARSAAAS